MHLARSLMFVVVIAGVLSAVTATSPPRLQADPGVGGCVNVVGVSACSSVGVNVPNINAVANAIPNIGVPNINIPHVNGGGFHGGGFHGR